jgi:glycosyltransferase involved in cell wall biosynthesis
VPWVNQHGVSGLTVEPGDADALATAMRRLGGDPLERERLGRAAAARAQSQFSQARMLESFKRVVEQVVEQPERLPALAGVGSI